MFRAKFQSLLISFYAVANTIGITRFSLGKKAFSFIYYVYKEYFEDPHAQLINRYPELFEGGHLVDVGANIGYVSTVLAQVLEPKFSLFCFEPEKSNFAILTSNLNCLSNRDSIFAFEQAVGDLDGEGTIVVNRAHHGDHRLVSTNPDGKQDSKQLQNVKVIALDSFFESIGSPQPVVFVKIDVQGNEHLVLNGMKNLIARNKDLSLSLEITKNDALTAQTLLSVCGPDFRFFEILKNGELKKLGRDQIVDSEQEYRNILVTGKGYIEI